MRSVKDIEQEWKTSKRWEGITRDYSCRLR